MKIEIEIDEVVENKPTTPTLCINMIVKNESKIITRMLDTVLPIIDAYCICDTGSTDNTVKVIEDYFKEKNIPGKVVVEPFINFPHNRNFALKACEGLSDYVLLMDADMKLKIIGFDKNRLKEYDSCYILQGSDNFFYQNMRIVKNDGRFSYNGVTHEYVNTPPDNKLLSIKKHELFIEDLGDGGCKNDKFDRDVRLLTGAIAENPKCDRSHFYLANSYHDSGHFDKAIPIYEKRIELGGWAQEVWYSYYRLGTCYKNTGNIDKAISVWMEGYQYLPIRVENLYEIIYHYRHCSKHRLAEMFYKTAKQVIAQNPNRHDYLFLHNDIYTYKIDFEFTIIGCYLGVKNINDEVVNILNNCGDGNMIDNLLRNMKFYKHILKPVHNLNFDETCEKELNGEKMKLWSSSSCILPKKDGTGYMINIRYVNYYINGEGRYLNCDKNIVTFNRYAELTKNFTPISDKWFITDDTHRRYVGVEDVRIYNDDTTGELLFIGTGLHQNGNIGIVSGKYDITKDKLEPTELTASFGTSGCEKNWVFAPYKKTTHIIYKWAPLQICTLRDDGCTIDKVDEKPMPRIFERVRGSSCGFKYTKKNKYGNEETEVWFVAHVVSYEEPRVYYDMLIVFDEALNLLRYSAPFKFNAEPIEYSLGLIVKDDCVMINYSVWDRTTCVGIYDKNYIDSVTKYTP